MKKQYMKPGQHIVVLQQQSHLLQASGVNNVTGNASLRYGGGGTGSARVRSHGDIDWDDDEW